MDQGYQHDASERSRRSLGVAVALLLMVGLLAAWYVAGRHAGEVSTGASGGTPRAAATAFWGHRWQLETRSDRSHEASTFAGLDGRYVLDTTRPGRVSFTGCNGGSGSASSKGLRLVVGDIFMTEMACADADGEALMAFDSWMSTFLSSGPTISVDGNRLTLTTNASRAVFRGLGPAAPTSSTTPGSPDEPVSNTPSS